ncbi:MAG: aldehyde:ferredoxin oxidoreductase [Desulfobulbaceae bacterium BRH_c16a]|nr:MAG: aldehyde:ferredoxin oxidoreductase [Desulfobulbaceae bacterium BRH_c16a]KJS02258.1 MAG: aldehyde:ferredoxin oxidoreductase [Desulfobulbaceae bacterium BRH_c16a]
MIREEFRVLLVDVSTGKGKIVLLGGRNAVAGGSGLAALLFSKYGHPGLAWNDEAQPLIFAIGPLTGYFPLMSKMVCSFKSNYHNEYTESHAGGRAALSLRFADLDALVISGRAKRLSCLSIGANHLEVKDASFLKGMDAERSGKLIRRMFKDSSGHRSILRIGPAGEEGLAMACINVDTYRHFGRMGGGAAMGAKKLKAIVIHGDTDFNLPAGKGYAAKYKEMYKAVTSTDMMRKYHNLGTPANLQTLNDISSLPWNNLQQTSDPRITSIDGGAFADETLLRNGACSGCPVGCIHIGYIREKTAADNRYHYHQVAYDYEPIFAAGTMLGVTKPFDVLRILDVMEKVGLDAMSGGVALAWATEATGQGLVSVAETLVPLSFGDADAYRQAANHLGRGSNEFYRLLGQGTLKAAEVYGGGDFACVLGQEMAGYATGELFFAAQTLGFRHSHLDTGAYSYDQKDNSRDIGKAVDFLMADEPGRAFLTSMVGCLFARSVYSEDQLAECLDVVGFHTLAANIPETSESIRQLRWKVRAQTGFKPENFSIPKRFYQVKTWKGQIDGSYLNSLKEEYGRRIMALIGVDEQPE